MGDVVTLASRQPAKRRTLANSPKSIPEAYAKGVEMADFIVGLDDPAEREAMAFQFCLMADRLRAFVPGGAVFATA